jgi:hypothetical protein
MPPRLIVTTNNNLMDMSSVLNNLPSIDQIVLIRPLPRLFLIPRNPRLDVSSHKPPPRDLELHIHEPALVHETRGLAPRRLVQDHVVPLEHDDAVPGPDGDVVLLRVLDRVVEGRREDRRGRGREGFPQGPHEGQEGGSVECEFGPSARVRSRRVWHGGELGPRQVVTIHGHEGGDGHGFLRLWVQASMPSIESLCHDLRESGLSCSVLVLRACGAVEISDK